MTNFAAARDNMIESQVRPNGITDRRIIAAMQGLAREDYVPESSKSVAYMDEDVQLAAPGRVLIEAMAFAKLVQLAEIKPNDKVLCVGAGTGYGSAILASLSSSVVALESDPGLAAEARSHLGSMGHVKVVEGPLEAGDPSEGPFDVIIMEGRVEEVPAALLAQLAEGGRLVAVVGETEMGRAHVFTATAKGLATRPAFDASITALPGFVKRKPAFVF